MTPGGLAKLAYEPLLKGPRRKAATAQDGLAPLHAPDSQVAPCTRRTPVSRAGYTTEEFDTHYTNKLIYDFKKMRLPNPRQPSQPYPQQVLLTLSTVENFSQCHESISSYCTSMVAGDEQVSYAFFA